MNRSNWSSSVFSGMIEQPVATSAWSPLGEPLFRTLWIAAVVSNVGIWMQEIAAAWLMTSLTSAPLMVALVQTATSLPIVLLALPAGALADIVDRRRLLLFTIGWGKSPSVVRLPACFLRRHGWRKRPLGCSCCSGENSYGAHLCSGGNGARSYSDVSFQPNDGAKREPSALHALAGAGCDE